VKSSLRREPDVPGDLLRALFGNVTEPTEGLNRVRNGSFRQASKFPLVAENCRWQALHLKTRRHRYSIGSVRGSGVVIRIIGAIFQRLAQSYCCLS
jgi:hypothetical protein